MRYILLLLILNLSSQCIYAQKKVLIPITKFSAINNRPINNIRDVLKDKYGFVWIGTQDGLVRYDGINAVSYDKNTTNTSYSILNNDIDALITIPGNHFLWVLNSYGGICKINLITGKVVSKIRLFVNNDSSLNFLHKGMQYYNGFIFIVAQEGYIFKINVSTDKFSYIKLPFKRGDENVQEFYLFNNNFFLCLSNGKILLFDPLFSKIITQETIPHHGNSFRFLVAARLNKDEMLFGTSEGVKKSEI